MAKTNAPTMKDVAREAGVSLGTVSKVINGITVREEYKKKVEAAIAFVNGRPEGKAVITSLENLGALIESESGTIIQKD